VWDCERGETSKVPDVPGDDTTIVASRPGQYVVVGVRSQANLYVEYRQHVVPNVSQALRERRRVHLIKKKDAQPQQLEVHDSPLSGGATITLS
jgi:glycerate-2-kinase